MTPEIFVETSYVEIIAAFKAPPHSCCMEKTDGTRPAPLTVLSARMFGG